MASATIDWVIDADTHITEPRDLFTSRLPARLRDRAPRVVQNENGQDVWQVGDEAQILTVGSSAVAGWKQPFPASPSGYDEVPKAAVDADARLEYMDSLAIWAMALYPNVGGFGSQAFLKLEDPELMLACVRAYNDFVTDWIAPDPRRFIPITALPFWDVEASVKEIERCAAMGHKGILFSGEPHSHGQPVLASPHWTPLWECAESNGLPVSFHIGSGDFSPAGFFTEERVPLYGLAGCNGMLTVSLFLGVAQQITDLLYSGVLPRHPGLKVIAVESGIGFIPFLLEAVDHCFDYGNGPATRPEFKMRPSEYFKRQVYGCYFFEEYAPAHLLDGIPEDNVLFETDYPHPVCLYGNVREKIDAGLAEAKPSVRRKLLFDNAARLYGVEAPDREPKLRA